MKSKFIKIKNRFIGYDHKPLIIAEIGINHNGNLETAKRMANLALYSGADVIKHQTHVVNDEMSHEADLMKVKYIGKSIYQLMKNCALSEVDEFKLKKYVEKKGGIFLSTPFSRAAADRLAKFNVPAFKIGSGECNNYPLIEHICKFKKPIILSTGMNSIKEIKESVKIIRKFKIPYALLHTTNIYPTPFHLVRLEAMRELQENFSDAIIGLSDHTVNNLACYGAIAMGASIIERHFTDNIRRKGPDIKNSMTPKSCKELVQASKILFQIRGGKKKPIKEEKPVIDFAFASVVSINEIKKGQLLTKKNIWVKRPGTGPFYAKDYKKLLGCRAIKDIGIDNHIKKDDINY
jgi:N-acetylneuraminate synthase